MKIRKLVLRMIATSMVVCLLVGCGKRTQLVKTTESAVSANAVSANAVNAKVPEDLAIQSMEGLTLDGTGEFPYSITMCNSAVEAIDHLTPLHLKDAEGSISFTLVVKNNTLLSISDGLIVEKDEKIDTFHWGVTTMGNIQTFSIDIEGIEEPSTIVYEMKCYDEDELHENYKYIAFQILPQQ